MSHYVIDWETMANCSVLVAEDYKTDETKVFVIHKLRNDFKELMEFLEKNRKDKEWHIGFNSLNFDSQITEYLLRNKSKLIDRDGEEISSRIYQVAQDVISRQNRGEWLEFNERQLSIKQVDVFRMNHWDNANKRSSLKWVQYSMDWKNIQEMPIHHSKYINTMKEINLIISYCINDVKSTKRVMYLSKPLIDVRSRIYTKYGLKCHSYSNTKLGSELLLSLYCDATGNNPWEVKKLRTRRGPIPIKDILFPYINFKTLDLQGFHEMLKNKVIVNTRKDFSYSLDWNGYTFDYGLGGIHQCIETGIYKADEKFVIKDLDVASLYPSIACVNEMYPSHLGKAFFEVYKRDIVDVRLAEKSKPKDQRDMAIIEGFKEAANSTYGNSNSEYSWLYDPLYTMQTTINGQLLITMLVEDLVLNIPGAQLLQTNTDGATLRFPKESLEVYSSICREWEKVTKLTLEFADYSAMYIWDVNNYFAMTVDGKSKCKGRFEWEDLQNHKHTHLHKNKSFLIIPKAIFNYFVNDIPPERFLAENRNIFDYCAGVKIKGDWEFRETCMVEGKVQETPLQKTIRYYMSRKGCKIVKVNKGDGRCIQVEASKGLQRDFTNYQELKWEQYDVDDSYYLEKIYQEIANIQPLRTNQLTMF